MKPYVECQHMKWNQLVSIIHCSDIMIMTAVTIAPANPRGELAVYRHCLCEELARESSKTYNKAVRKLRHTDVK